MSQAMKHVVAFAIVVAVVGVAPVLAHLMTFKGTVAGIEPSRIQVKTGEEKQGVLPGWYPIDAKTKIMRGKKVVTFEQARITIGERVVVNVDHQSDAKMRTLDIRLAEQ